MKKTFFIWIFISFYISILFSASNNELLKRTIAITSVFYQDDKKEYEYLKDIIRDALKAKLIAAENFDFITFSSIDQNAKKYFFNQKDYTKKDKLIKFALSLGADVLIVTQYSIENQKITIKVKAIDITDTENDIIFSGTDHAGVEIFPLIQKISNNITAKMSKVFKNIKKSELEKRIKQKYGNKKQKEFTHEKDIVKKENKLVYKYFGIHLGTSYEDILTIVENSRFKYKKAKNKIILYGNLSGFPNTEYTIFNFEDNKLIDSAVFIGYPLQIGEEVFSDFKNQLVSILGTSKKNNEQDKLLWRIKNKTLEFSSVFGAKGYILYYFHYSINDYNKPIDFSLQNINIDTNWFGKAIEISIGGSINYYPFNVINLLESDVLIHSSYYQFLQFSGEFYFSYYPNPYFSIGFMHKIGYGFNFIIYPLEFAGGEFGELLSYYEVFPFFHNFYNEIRLTHKIGRPMSKFKFVIEYGGFIIARFVSTLKSYNDNLLGFITTKKQSIAGQDYFHEITIPNYFLLGGPSIFIGMETRNKTRNFNFIFGGVIRVEFGRILVNEYYYEPEYFWTGSEWQEKGPENPTYLENYYTNIFGINLGVEARVFLNMFKVLK